MYESSLKEKMEEIAFLNQQQKRLDNLVTSKNGNTNDQDIEVFYASGNLAQSQYARNEIS